MTDDTTKPCSERIENGGWCLLPAGHTGEHRGIARTATYPAPTYNQGMRKEPKKWAD